MPRSDENSAPRAIAGVLAVIWLCTAAVADTLTIATWGGAYERSQAKAYFEPFTSQTGVAISTQRYKGGIKELREQVKSGRVQWDLVDLVMADNLQACALGLLEPIDHSSLQPAPDGTPAEQDFFPDTLTRCGVPQIVYSTVLAFDARAFPAHKPQSVSALFNLRKFPGKRALQRQPIAVLEWALRSYGVPRPDIYTLLSTDRGLDLAFERLEEIKSEIIWWEDGATPVKLLAAGEVVIASGFNGRFFDAAVNQRLPIQTLWDSQIYEYSTWGIPRGAPETKTAHSFLHFATRTEQLAEQAKYISYGPARASSAALVWKHTRSGMDIRPHLPTHPANFEQGIAKDHEWYARTQQRLNKRFLAWLQE